MRPFDPRLGRDIRPIRGAIATTAVLSFLAAAFLVVQALCVAQAVTTAFLDRAPWSKVSTLVLVGALAWISRVLLTSLNEAVSRKAGLKAVAEIRAQSVKHILRIPQHRLPMPTGALTALLNRGIDGVEIYVTRYLPQLVIAAIVPLGIGAVVLWLDPLAAVILVFTMPLIPLFMALVGWFTSDHVDRHWQRVVAVSGTLADLLSGLPELKIFGRARAQAQQIQTLGDQQKDATMKVLRLSFLSAFVLELLATISVAIIAVEIGLRLTNGEMELWRGLAALILAPEVYAPVRMLGVHFHAAADGLEAWNKVKDVLDTPSIETGSGNLATNELSAQWTDLEVVVSDRNIHVPAGSIAAGQLTAVVGPSGCGKSTLLQVLLGNRDIASGELTWTSGSRNIPSTDINKHDLYSHIAYVGQNAWLGEGTVREVVTRGNDRDFSDSEVQAMLESLSLDVDMNTEISDRSQGVSVGQRRRLAVARALLRSPKVLILDEPAAALDPETETVLIAAIKSYVVGGGAAIVVAHRSGFRNISDQLIDFTNQVISA